MCDDVSVGDHRERLPAIIYNEKAMDVVGEHHVDHLEQISVQVADKGTLTAIYLLLTTAFR